MFGLDTITFTTLFHTVTMTPPIALPRSYIRVCPCFQTMLTYIRFLDTHCLLQTDCNTLTDTCTHTLSSPNLTLSLFTCCPLVLFSLFSFLLFIPLVVTVTITSPSSIITPQSSSIPLIVTSLLHHLHPAFAFTLSLV
jgi:hypothetical protein